MLMVEQIKLQKQFSVNINKICKLKFVKFPSLINTNARYEKIYSRYIIPTEVNSFALLYKSSLVSDAKIPVTMFK